MKATVIVTFVVSAIVAVASGANAQEPVRYRDLVYEASGISVTNDLPYGQAVNSADVLETLLLDVYQPIGDTAPWRAAVVWVHGGYFKRGSKEDYQNEIYQWARSGYVVFSINYRLRPELPEGLGLELLLGRIDEYIDAITDAQHDAQAAVRWVRLHASEYDIDPDRVALVGHSAGGLTATAVAFNSDDPGSSGNPGPSSRVNAAVAMAGGGAPVRQIRIDPGDSPILFVHGLSDQVVPYLPAALPPCLLTIAMTNVCEQVLDPDQGHGTFGHAEVRDFLYRTMIERPTLREPTRVTIIPSRGSTSDRLPSPPHPALRAGLSSTRRGEREGGGET